jgi:ribosomal protein L12E/L44/L45/RPP1/RPP2
MSNPEKSLLSLQKLYAKRKELDKLITDAEKKLVAGAKAPAKAPAAKTAGRPKAAAPKAARKPRAAKKV